MQYINHNTFSFNHLTKVTLKYKVFKYATSFSQGFPGLEITICDPGAVLSSTGIFIAIAKNTLHGSKL